MKFILFLFTVILLTSIHAMAQNPLFKTGQQINIVHDVKTTNSFAKTENTNTNETMVAVLSQSDTNYLFAASFIRFYGTVTVAITSTLITFDTDRPDEDKTGMVKMFEQLLNKPVQISLNKKTGKASLVNTGELDLSSTFAMQIKLSTLINGFVADAENMVIDQKYKLKPGLKWKQVQRDLSMGTYTTNTTLMVKAVSNGTATIQTTSKIKGEATTTSEWDSNKKIVMEMSGTGHGEIIADAVTNFVKKTTRIENIETIFNADGVDKTNITKNVSVTTYTIN